MEPSDKEKITRALSWAPSADNSQPWRYRWTESSLDLWITTEGRPGPSDGRFVLSDLAMGAGIENAYIQARALGYHSGVEHFPAGAEDTHHVARMTFEQGEQANGDLAAVIPVRQTDRRFPFRGPVSKSARQALEGEAEQFPGIGLIWLAPGTQQRRAALSALWLAESLRFRHRGLHEELFGSIRFDAGRRGTCDQGLAPAALAVEAPMWPLFRALRHWPLMRLLRFTGTHRALGFRAAVLPALLSPGLCLIVTTTTGRSGILTAGRALERLWLRATTQGLAVQPLASIGVLSLGLARLDGPAQAAVRKLQHRVAEICPGAHPVAMLRLGHLRGAPPSRSGRLAPEALARPEGP